MRQCMHMSDSGVLVSHRAPKQWQERCQGSKCITAAGSETQSEHDHLGWSSTISAASMQEGKWLKHKDPA